MNTITRRTAAALGTAALMTSGAARALKRPQCLRTSKLPGIEVATDRRKGAQIAIAPNYRTKAIK